MKTLLCVSVLLSSILLGRTQQLPSEQQSSLDADSAKERSSELPEIGFNHRIVHYAVSKTNTLGLVQLVTNKVVELQTGTYFEKNGILVASKAFIEMDEQRGGAKAENGRHKAWFSGDINQATAVKLTTPDQKVLSSRIMGLAFYDYRKNKNTLIAELKNSIGTIIGDNQVLYADAFDGGFKADVLYTYTKDGLEQDIIFRERPPLPEEYGFDPQSTRIEVWTEFFNASQPHVELRTRKGWSLAKVAKVIEFGDMRIGGGAAFGLGGEINRHSGIEVNKQWVQIGERSFLVEDVSFRSSIAQLRLIPAMPKQQAAIAPDARRAMNGRLIPPSRKEAKAVNSQKMKVAAAGLPPKGYVLDYSIVLAETNFVFRGDTTYYINGNVNLASITTIEGGAVIKYTNGASINILGGVDCLTEPYHPAIFTSYNDNTVGETIVNGDPSGNYADVALSLGNGGNLQYLQIRYANKGIYSSQDYNVSHMQFVHCGTALQTANAMFTAKNVLMNDVTNGFGGYAFNGMVQHLTFHEGGQIIDDEGYDPGTCSVSSSTTLTLVNSLLFGFTGWGTYTPSLDHTEYATSDPGTIFNSVGFGAHYLSDSSPYRDAGTANISDTLLPALRKKTTYAPVLLTNNITTNTTLSSVAPRDVDVLDLGYHYDPIDFAINGLALSAALTLTNGCSIAFLNDNASLGMFLGSGSQLRSEGSPTNMIRLVWYNTVQEQSPDDLLSYGNGNMFYTDAVTGMSEMRCRFTDFCRLGSSNASYLNDLGGTNGMLGAFRYQNCRFAAGKLAFHSSNGSSLVAGLTNCLFQRTAIETVDRESGLTLEAHNNLFYGGRFVLHDWNTNSGTVLINCRNNAFDKTVISQSSSVAVTNGYNAYILTADRLLPTNSIGNNLVLTNFPAPVAPISPPGAPCLWLKADSGVTTNASGLVTAWQDQSSSGNDALQSDTNKSPLFVNNVFNGKPALRFDGNQNSAVLGDFMQGTGDVGLANGGFTSFLVYKMADRSIGEQIPCFIGVPGQNNMARCYYVRYGFELGNVNEMAFGSWANDYGSGFVIPANTLRIWSYRANDALTRLELFDSNGPFSYMAVKPISGFETPDAGYYVGGLGAYHYNFQGDIAEIIFYQGALTDGDRQLTIDYLKNKYQLSSPSLYEAGPLGRFYQIGNSPLFNAGTTNASNLGLYHYTTQAGQTKETNSIVDIGFHYIATDATGNPMDLNGDGILDYVADENGNGTLEFGELPLGITIESPANGSKIP